MKLEGRKILITGGGSGIGLELARRLSGENAVVIAGRDEAKLERAREATPTLRAVQLDVTSEEDAGRAIAWVRSELGGLDILVNNAGLFRGYHLTDPEAATKSGEDVDANLGGPIRMTRLALPLLEASSAGAIVFVSSGVALAAAPGFAVYAATKAALHSLARSLRTELAPTGIRVFEVLPPVVDTAQASALDVAKLPPSRVAATIIAGLARDRLEIRVGRIRSLQPLARVSPRVADRLVASALGATRQGGRR